MRIIGYVLICLLIINGCASQSEPENEEWTESPLFNSGIYSMIGQEGKLGFIYDDDAVSRFYAQQEQKYMWHFWGKQEELEGAFKVTATSKETGDEVTIVELPGIWGPINGADGHVPTQMSLPSPGFWKLDAYIGERIFGSIIVRVHETDEG